MPVLPSFIAQTEARGRLRVDPRVESVGPGLASVGNALMQTADVLAISRERDEAAASSESVAGAREFAQAKYREIRDDALPDKVPRLKKELEDDFNRRVSEGKTRSGQEFRRSRFNELRAHYISAIGNDEANGRVAHRLLAHREGVATAARVIEADPQQYERAAAEQLELARHLGLSPAEFAEESSHTLSQLRMAKWQGRAAADPRGTLELLRQPVSGDPSLDALSPSARDALIALANEGIEAGEANRILSLSRQDVRAGDAALSALEDSGLPPERLDGIRRRVREGVGLMRSERAADHLDRVTKLEGRIATGAQVGAVQTEIENLYRQGALTPAQFASMNERATVNAVRVAEAEAARRELLASIQVGMPLDPQDRNHREFLESTFGLDAQGMKPGAPEWQALALGYAGQVRMLPPQASSWLRSAARTRDRQVAIAAAQFYGGLEQQSPEAAGGIDTDTRAFLAQLSGLLEAGSADQVAFETARANVFEIRKDVREQREAAFREHAKGSASALEAYVDRDFDPGLFSAQPATSAALQADFDRQAAAYFSKVGDIALARDLAWQDLRRVYGVTRVNGEPIVTAFPLEQFGVTPEEARQDVAAFLRSTGQDLRVEDVLIVPDGVTLRSVYDALSGKPQMPSYRLVTTAGDLVLDAEGVPQRYTLPSGEALTKRVRESQARARKDAELAIEEARARRDRRREMDKLERELDAAFVGGQR